nr:glycosyltransferase [Salinibacter ruber]
MPNGGRIDLLQNQTNGEATAYRVRNVPTKDEVASPRDAAADEIRLMYQGSLNEKRLPFTVLEALKRVSSSVSLVVVGYETSGHRGFVDEFKHRAERLEVRDRVNFVGSLPRNELLNLCSQCDIGLALIPMEPESINMRHMVGASVKPFDYLSQGLPILFSDLGEWRKAYGDPGFGLPCDPRNPESIAGAIQSFVSRPDMLRDFGEAGRRQIMKKWNYESEFRKVKNLMERKA